MITSRTGRSIDGFTLVELLVAVVIVGILASIAVPGYQRYIRDARRSDAQGALMGLASAMERYYTINNTYCGVTATPPAPPNPRNPACTITAGAPTIYAAQSPVDGGRPIYDLAVSGTTNTYTLTATPIAGTGQENDGFLNLTHTGIRGWDKDGNGATTDDGEDCWERFCN